jgi:DNA-binding CsgD family transcriptional regulator
MAWSKNGNGNSPHGLLNALVAGLDLLKTGVAVTNSGSRLLLINREAEEVLSARDGLEIAPGDILQLSTEGCPLPVKTMLEEYAIPQGRDGVAVSIHRPSGKRPLTVCVRPAPVVREVDEAATPAALVFILDPERPAEAPQADLHQLYGLTAAESNLANCLMQGKTLNESCEQLGIRHSTGRMHLRNLFSKTGVRRQSELVGLLFKNHGLVSTHRDHARSCPETGAVPMATLSPRD